MALSGMRTSRTIRFALSANRDERDVPSPGQDEHQDENGLVVLASSSIHILNGQPSTLSPCPGSQARALVLCAGTIWPIHHVFDRSKATVRACQGR
jgi:hypothetical protein